MVRKFGCLYIQEILFLTKSSLRTHVRPFMLADARHACHFIDSCQNKVNKVLWFFFWYSSVRRPRKLYFLKMLPKVPTRASLLALAKSVYFYKVLYIPYAVIYYLLTREWRHYREISDRGLDVARSIHQGRGVSFPFNDRTHEVNKLRIIWLFY